jgi:DNA-binding CsgD family transcriptional regulator
LDTTGKLILQIYRAARDTAVEEFQDIALGLLRSAVPFTSSRWATFELQNDGQHVIYHYTHLQNEPQDIVVDWDAVSDQDRFKDMMLANLGKACAIHSPSFFAGREVSAMLDYTQRYQHANSLGIIASAQTPGCLESLSLFRSSEDDCYIGREQKILEQLMPHLSEALSHSRMLGLQRAGLAEDPSGCSAVAIARCDGLISYATPAFTQLLLEEWIGAKTGRLPRALLEEVAKPGSAGFRGVCISVSATRLGEAMFLRANSVRSRAQRFGGETGPQHSQRQGDMASGIANALDASLTKERLRAAGAEAALDQFAVAAFLLNPTRKLSYMNRAAAGLVRGKDGLVLRSEQLAARSPAQQAALDALIARVGSGNGVIDEELADSLALTRASGKRPLQVRVLPLRGAAGTLGTVGHVLVLVTDPDCAPRYPDSMLRELYGFTAAEAQIANHLIAGRSLDEIAVSRAVSIGTARVQLKQMLAKTGTRGQADLIRLLLSPPRTIDRNG